MVWILCLLIICFRNQKPILLFIGISSIIYLVIQYCNNLQIDKKRRAQQVQADAQKAVTKSLLASAYQQWQEIDGPEAFIQHPILISVYFHLLEQATDLDTREKVRSSIHYADVYLSHQAADKREKQDALYNCIKLLDGFINDTSYTDTVVLIHDYLTTVKT